MKNLSSFLFIVFLSLSLMAQNGLNNGSQTRKSTSCKWQKNEVDPFTGVKHRTTQLERVGYNSATMKAVFNNSVVGNVKFAISENVTEQDTSYVLRIETYTSPGLCFDNESKVLIKSGETIITIKLLDGIICGELLSSYGNIGSQEKEFLRHNPIDLLRVQFSGDGNTIINFDLKEINRYNRLIQDYFIKTFKCFE